MSADSVGISADVELGLLLRHLRRRHGLSQRDLLRPLHLGSHSVIVDWEAGRRIPSAGMLRAYEKLFSLVPGHLVAVRDRALAERAAADADQRMADASAIAAGAAVPRQLPGTAAPFVGRVAALAELDRMLRERAASTVVISAIGGMAGIGKTALALHFAHEVAARFPDGQLYVNLRGFDTARPPVTPEEAICRLLDALEVPAARIPADLEAQAGLYRSVLAERRVLVLLDNALDGEQVRPLLPSAPGSLILVTSRNQLTSLVADGSHHISLDRLSAAECHELLSARLGADRVAAEPEATAEIIVRCAGLPLALAIAAARAATRPAHSLQTLVTDLRGGQLAALDAGDGPATDIRAVFSLSYRTLTSGAAQLFRYLGMHSGPDITASAAASLAGQPAARVCRCLDELLRAHLISEHIPGRFVLHDLVRAYAREQAWQIDSESERRAAIYRVLDHYIQSAQAADSLLEPGQELIIPAIEQPGVTAETPADHGQALAWFSAEHAVLLAAIDAGDPTCDTRICQLAWLFWTFLDRQGFWHDQAKTQRAALAAATRLGNAQLQAHAHRNLARACAQLGGLDEAKAHLQRALDQYGQAGDLAGQGVAYLNLAIVCGQQGHDAEALANSERALDLYRSAGHQRGQARAQNNIGWYNAQLGNFQHALAACEQAVELHREVDDLQGQAGTWDTLGYVHHRLADYDHAASCYQRAVGLYRDLDDRYYEADTLVHLGDTCHSAGKPRDARDAWQQALTILVDLRHDDARQVRAKVAALAAAAPSADIMQPSDF